MHVWCSVDALLQYQPAKLHGHVKVNKSKMLCIWMSVAHGWKYKNCKSVANDEIDSDVRTQKVTMTPDDHIAPATHQHDKMCDGPYASNLAKRSKL